LKSQLPLPIFDLKLGGRQSRRGEQNSSA